MSRGFGSTFGAGTTDKIVAASVLTASSTQVMCYSVWLYRNGPGGGNFGRAFSSTSGTETTLSFNTSIAFASDWSTTDGAWRVTTDPGTGKWYHMLVVYDASSVSNDPVIYIDGVSVAVTETSTPAGTAADITATLNIGNRTANNRVWDGMIAHLAIWNNVTLGADEARALASGVSPLRIRRGQLVCYLPLDGVNNPEFAYVGAPTTSITGTRNGTTKPPVQFPADLDVDWWPAPDAAAQNFNTQSFFAVM